MMINSIKKALAVCVLGVLPVTVLAQKASPKNELSLRYGNTHGVVKDEVYSPLNYKSSGGTIGVNFLRQTKNEHLFSAQIELKTYEMTTEVSNQFAADQVQVTMEIAYLRKVFMDSERGCELFVGADLHSNGNLINFEDVNTLSNSGTFVSHRGLGVQALRRGYFKKNRITVHAKLPVIGQVYRSPYNVFTKGMNDDQIFSFIYSNGQFGAVHNYFNPSVAASISRPIIGKLFFTAGYEFNYLRSSVNKPITHFQGRLLLATSIKF